MVRVLSGIGMMLSPMSSEQSTELVAAWDLEQARAEEALVTGFELIKLNEEAVEEEAEEWTLNATTPRHVQLDKEETLEQLQEVDGYWTEEAEWKSFSTLIDAFDFEWTIERTAFDFMLTEGNLLLDNWPELAWNRVAEAEFASNYGLPSEAAAGLILRWIQVNHRRNNKVPNPMSPMAAAASPPKLMEHVTMQAASPMAAMEAGSPMAA